MAYVRRSVIKIAIAYSVMFGSTSTRRKDDSSSPPQLRLPFGDRWSLSAVHSDILLFASAKRSRLTFSFTKAKMDDFPMDCCHGFPCLISMQLEVVSSVFATAVVVEVSWISIKLTDLFEVTSEGRAKPISSRDLLLS